MRLTIAVGLALIAGGCQRTGQESAKVETAAVQALAETDPVGKNGLDAADDPAIWRNPVNPAASLIVATDKRAGLHVYGLGGKSLAFDPAGRLNNVDLVDLGARGILVVASDRNDPANAKLRAYRLDPNGPRLIPLGTVAGGRGEAYGICLAVASDGTVQAWSVLKQGAIIQLVLDYDGRKVSGEVVRRLSVPTQPEGCIADPRTNQLYVGEEDAGIRRFDARADGPDKGTLVVKVDRKQLVADVEGLALAPEGADGGWLIASSQGDNAFALYRLPGMEPAGRFRIGKGKFGSVEETDGINLLLGDFGPQFPAGLFVAQDGENPPVGQNFKLVSWADVLKALEKRQ